MNAILTVAEVARVLKTSPKTVTRLLETGQLKGKQLGGGDRNYWRITQAQLDEYLAAPDEPKGAAPLPVPPVSKRLLRLS